MSSSPDPLERLLERWKHETPPPPEHLSAEVWRRISVAENTATARPSWWRLFDAALTRPSFAAAFMAACMLLGLFLAEVRSSRLQAESNAQLMQSYLRLINPLVDAADAPNPHLKRS